MLEEHYIKSCIVLKWKGGIYKKACGNLDNISWGLVPKMSLGFLLVSSEVYCLSIHDLSLRDKNIY